MAISLERYLAIRRPLSYQRLLTPLRCKLLIFAVWIVSLFICLPAFFKKSGGESFDENSTIIFNCSKRKECTIEGSETPGEKLYTIYSACGSFFIPASIMLVFYAQIYRTAVRSIKAMRTGRLITNGGGAGGEMCLRVHYGTARTTSNISSSVAGRKITPSPRSPLRRYQNSPSAYALEVSNDPLSPQPRVRSDSNASRGVRRSESAGSKAEMMTSTPDRSQSQQKSDSNSSRTPNAEKTEDTLANKEGTCLQCAARKQMLPQRQRSVPQSQCPNESQLQSPELEGQSHPDPPLINAHCQMHSPFPPISEDPAGESQSLLNASDSVFHEDNNCTRNHNSNSNNNNISNKNNEENSTRTSPQRPQGAGNQCAAARGARLARELSGRSVGSQHGHGGMSRSLSETSSENVGSTSALPILTKRPAPAISQSTTNLHHLNAARSPGGGRNSLVVDGVGNNSSVAVTPLFARVQLSSHQQTIRNPTAAARHSETRALKTVAVICGTFVCCWMPFFVSYLIQPFCECVPDIMWDVCFWLGYLNSACNPLSIVLFPFIYYFPKIKALLILYSINTHTYST